MPSYLYYVGKFYFVVLEFCRIFALAFSKEKGI